MPCTCEITEVSPNNDYAIRITGLVDVDESELNSGIVTYQIYDTDDTLVIGASGTISPDGSGGNYTGTIDKTIIDLLTLGYEYIVRITGTQSGADFEIDIPLIVKRRR